MMAAAEGWQPEGGWPVVAGAAKRGAGEAANVQIDARNWLIGGAAPAMDVARDGDGTWRITYTTPRGRLEDVWAPAPKLGPHGLRRHLAYTNTSAEAQDLTGAVLRVAPLAEVLQWAPSFFRMTGTAGGTALCTAYWSNGDGYRWSNPGEEPWRVDVQAGWRLAPGESGVIGHQSLWLGEAGVEAFRAEARRWYAAQGLDKAPPYPAWLRAGILYEVCAGGHIDSRFSDVGGFDGLRHQLDYLADLGVNGFWLNAVHSHKTPPNPVDGGWNHYDPRDFAAVDPILGGPEGLARLTEAMAERGIHGLSEIVPHGGHSVQAEQLESAWTYNRDGALARPWGGFGMDNAAPPWQGVVRDAMALVGKGFGFEGARFDVADGQGPNWGSPYTNHASLSTLGGGCAMLGAIRDGIRQGGTPFPIVIPESLYNRPEYYGVEGCAVLGYGFETTLLFEHHLPGDLRDAAALKTLIHDFYENERGSLPPGALCLRTLNNHDTVCAVGRVMYRFGVGLARALYATCCAVPGVPMLYQEEEIGSFDWLRRLHAARQALPELHDGTADYSIDAGEGIFTVLRQAEWGRTLCLINLSGLPTEARATLPGSVAEADAVLCDAISGRRVALEAGQLTWPLEPYGVAFLRIGALPEHRRAEGDRFLGETPSGRIESVPFQMIPQADGFRLRYGTLDATFTMGGGSWRPLMADGMRLLLQSPAGVVSVQPDRTGVAVECRLNAGADLTPVLRIFQADRWYVSGRTALLADRVLRRHFPFPEDREYVWRREHAWGKLPWGAFYRGVAPTGRLWQSLWEPLHPERPAVAFADHAGNALLVDAIGTDAMNVVLTDATDEGDPDPYGLELRFHAVDPDLAPRVQTFGMGALWERTEYCPIDRPLHLAFHISATGEVTERLDALRLPPQPPAYTETRKGPQFHQHKGAIFAPEPGTITWSGLAPVAGVYRIGLELRHSESAGDRSEMADKYTVTVDGQPQPLEWTAYDTFHTGNAYFGWAFTPPLDLGGRSRTVTIQTKATWCAVRPCLRLEAP